jgi:hypothetical protein
MVVDSCKQKKADRRRQGVVVAAVVMVVGSDERLSAIHGVSCKCKMAA